MKLAVIIVLIIITESCTPHLLSKETRQLIPKDANKVIMQFDMSTDSLYLFISEFLVNENFRIYNSSKEIGFINTDGKRFNSGMIIRLNITTTKNGNHSQLNCISEFVLISTENQKEIWFQGNMDLGGHFTLCYETMVMLLQKLPSTEIQYVKS